MAPRKLFKTDSWEFGHDSRAQEQPLARPGRRRAATTVVYAALFFAGATFTAFAGDHFAQMTSSEDASAPAADATPVDGSTDTTAVDATTTDATTPADTTPAETAPAEPAAADATAPATDATPDASAAPATDTQAAVDPSSTTDSADALTPARSTGWADASSAGSGSTGTASHSAPAAKPKKAAKLLPSVGFVLAPAPKPAAKPEIEGPEANATVWLNRAMPTLWLNRALPDPTPPALRLSPKFAQHLKVVAKTRGVDWALMLGVLRADGARGHKPASTATLRKLAVRLSVLRRHSGGAWATALAYDGKPAFADKVLALANYDRAVGLGALVNGLQAAKHSLEQRILDDPAISIYPGGRDDIAKDKVDVRVLATIAYLRQSFGQVTVSSLISGHRLYARPGVISAHVYGHAVDIAALGNTPILGHQQPGGLTEQAVHDILLLPAEVMPKQVISLLGLGGPSFPLADHYNHIHVGW